MKKFRVDTDEEFFNKFSELGDKLARMGYLFQNENVVVTEHDLGEWDDKWRALDMEIYNLEEEVMSRIFKIKE